KAGTSFEHRTLAHQENCMSDDAKKKADAPAVDESPEEAAKKKKKKLLIFAIIGALVVLGGGGGAFMMLSKGKKTQKDEEISKESTDHGDAHGDAKKDEHGAPAKDEHGDAKKDEHGEAKKDEHGEPAKDEHGAAAKDEHGDGHGDAKKDEHGAPAKDEHGEVKKDEHGNEIKSDGKDKGKADDKASESNIDFGETYKMSTFNLNLGNALENRYIRIEISLEYRGGAEQKKEIDRRLPQLRDAIIGIMQRKTREFLLSPDGKEALRKELLIRINRYMTKKIESVYITDLLIE
ncbi:MAG: DUF4366 domain-containing protein, partial [Proteobacteria bacterium]